MDVLGIDPSLTATGLARTFPDGRVSTELVRAGKDSGTVEDRRRRIRYVVSMVLRFAPQRCITLIERPVVTGKGGAAGSLMDRAWLYGLLLDQLAMRGPVIEVAPPTRAKLATGNGRAEKKDVLAALREAFPGVHVPDHNVADAAALMWAGARWLDLPGVPVMGEKQDEAMRSVRWPETKEKDA